MSIDPAMQKARVASEAAAGKLAAAIGRAVGAAKEFPLGLVEEELTKALIVARLSEPAPPKYISFGRRSATT